MHACGGGIICGAPDVAKWGWPGRERAHTPPRLQTNAPWLYSLPASTIAVMEYMKKKHWVRSQRMDIIFALLSCGLSVKPWRWDRMRAGWKDCIWEWRGGKQGVWCGKEADQLWGRSCFPDTKPEREDRGWGESGDAPRRQICREDMPPGT